MKKYARLRSTSSLPEQCEPCGGKSELASTTLSLDDDVDIAPGKWSSLKLSSPAHGSKHDGDDVPSSSSHRVLAEALKKLSSLRETHHDDDPLPRGVSTTHSWGTRIVDSEAGGGEPNSFFFGNWQRPRSAGSEQGSYRSSSNVGSVGSMQGIIRTESCTQTSHFTHRRSSSMHDVTLGQPSARPTSIAAISGNPRQAGKTGLAPCFQDEEEAWSPPQLRISSTSAAAAAPSARRLPVSANSPLQKSCSLWEEDGPKLVAGRSSAKRASAVQSMRYDRLQSRGLMGMELGKEEELQSQSVREGAAHAQAIAAMAKAYAEKYGVAQAVVECVSCGRGLGVIVEGNSPGSYDSSFCRSCRPPVLPVAPSEASGAASASASSWKKGGLSRGMMHYCRKLLLRMGKKPSSHKYTMV